MQEYKLSLQNATMTIWTYITFFYFYCKTYHKFTVIGENNVLCSYVKNCEYRNIVCNFPPHYLIKINLPITYVVYIFLE